MTLFEDLMWRGQIKDRTFTDDTWLNHPKTFYLGTDCSSSSLTIGNLAVYMLARRLVHAGWKAFLLVGGATSLIGDPGGKTKERELKSKEEIAHNAQALTKQVRHLLNDPKVHIVNNIDWFKGVEYLDFLREIGKHYSMSELLQRDFVAERIGEASGGISYAEFSYSLIQGYDYLQLYQHHHVVLQIGGSDQWGNMLSGVPLVRKKLDAEVHALSIPLVINKTTGQKFGKSETGAVWLDQQQTSPYQFFQFWINVDDESVEDYLKVYTELTKTEIENVLKQTKADPKLRVAQNVLAFKVTEIVHGTDRARRIQRLTNAIFQGNFNELTTEDLEELKTEVPLVHVCSGDDIVAILLHAGLASSNTEARRLWSGGAIYLNNVQVSADKGVIQDQDFRGLYALLRVGKNKLALVQRTK